MPYRRTPARFLAPVALVIALFAVFTTVRSTSDDGDDTPTVTQETRTTTTPTESRQRTRYTVRPGDVLSAIAADNGVSVDRILELNPDLDPQSLRAGQRIRLRR